MAVKVADFGLSEKLYMKLYTRVAIDGTVKLPVKWMAPESINFQMFSEKSDVVSTHTPSLFLSFYSSTLLI